MRGVTHISFVSPVSLDYRNISGIDSYLKGITKHQYITVHVHFVHASPLSNQNRSCKVSY